MTASERKLTEDESKNSGQNQKSAVEVYRLDGLLPHQPGLGDMKLLGLLGGEPPWSHTLYQWSEPDVQLRRIRRTLKDIASEPAFAPSYWCVHRAILLLKLIAGVLQHYDFITEEYGLPAFDDIVIWQRLKSGVPSHHLWGSPPSWLHLAFALTINKHAPVENLFR